MKPKNKYNAREIMHLLAGIVLGMMFMMAMFLILVDNVVENLDVEIDIKEITFEINETKMVNAAFDKFPELENVSENE